MPEPSPFDLTVTELRALLDNDRPLFPELENARAHHDTLCDASHTRAMLAHTEGLMQSLGQIPVTSYTAYRRFRNDGDRRQYETPYFLKRDNLSAAAFRMFLGQADLKPLVQDYMWAICEETNWVLPAHETSLIDLFSAETTLLLAETLHLLGDRLDEEVRHRTQTEVERRVFDPYLRYHVLHHWYRGCNNWNGVCNSSVAAAFLLMEPNANRRASALNIALRGLRVFLDTAFEPDGSSTEGVAYWHYGLTNLVVLSEMLYARSSGVINLLNTEQMQRIAAYPATQQLSGSSFASFSDCHELVHFSPGILARMALRTGEYSLLRLLAPPATPAYDGWLTMMLRNVLWWDGLQPDPAPLADAHLPSAGIARLVTQTPAKLSVVVAIKAGHNDENHNHNDVGSFLVHAGGENLLTDPGPGLYSRQYFSPERYANIFANSYGHSVPRIGGWMQEAGRQFSGEMLSVEDTGDHKRVSIEFARAYPLTHLRSARRQVMLAFRGEYAGTLWLQNYFTFEEAPEDVEEAFITWLDVDISGPVAVIRGVTQQLTLTIEEPPGAAFKLEALDEQCRMNAMPGTLKRLSFALPAQQDLQACVRMEVTRRNPATSYIAVK